MAPSLLRWAEVLLALIPLLAPALLPAAEPQLTAEQQVKNEEADQLQAHVDQLNSESKFPAALAVSKKVLAIRQEVLGPKHPKTALALNDVGLFLQETGDLAGAKKYYDQSLAVRQEVLGPKHPDTAESLHNLAYWMHAKKDHAAAKSLYEQALAIRTDALGPKHADVALNLTLIGQECIAAGDFAAAQPYLERALAIRRETLGLKDLSTASSFNTLGFVQGKLEDHTAAKTNYEQALDIQRDALGPKHLDVAVSLNNLAFSLRELGDVAGAKAFYEESLAIKRDKLGPRSPAVALSLNNLGFLLSKSGDRAAAKRYYEEALAIRKETLGLKNPETAMSLNNLGSLFCEMKDYNAAKPNFEQALAINREILGPKHAETVNSLAKLGQLYENAGDFKAAKPYFEQALAIRHETLGPNHPDTAAILRWLGNTQRGLNDFTGAKTYFDQALTIHQTVFGPKHPRTADSLADLGKTYTGMGDYKNAKPYYEQALAIRNEVLGSKHIDTGASLNDLGNSLSEMGNFAAAKPYFEQALEVAQANHGRQNENSATAIINVAHTYQALGDFAKAKPLLEEALAIHQEVFGKTSRETATALNLLGRWYKETGNFSEAKTYFEDALKIRTQTLGLKHAETAASLGDIGLLLEDIGTRTGDFSNAKEYLIKALEIDQEIRGPTHPYTVQAMSNLGLLLTVTRDFQGAEPLFNEVLRIKEATLTPKHPDIAISRLNLGGLYLEMDNVAAARLNLEQALAIYESSLGPHHPSTTLSKELLSRVHGAQGNWIEVANMTLAARKAVRAHVASVLPALRPAEQLQFIRERDADKIHAALSLGLHQLDYPPLTAMSAEFLCNAKGVIQESLAERSVLAMGAKNEGLKQLINQLKEARAELAALAQTTPQPGEVSKTRQRMEALELSERKLGSQANAGLRRSAQTGNWISLEQVRRGIPNQAVLVDLARFSPFSFQAKAKEKHFQPARYAAWITPAMGEGEVQIIDLGDAKAIDAAVQDFQAALKPCQSTDRAKNPLQTLGEPAAEKQLQVSLARIAALVLQPLRAKLIDKQEIILSPDSWLWLVPWGALPIDDGKYAIEQWNIHYVISARDLASERLARSSNPPRIFANPDYDLPTSEIENAWASVSGGARVASDANLLAMGDLRGRQAGGLSKVAPLPGTASEAAAITPHLHKFANAEPIKYESRFALEGVFKALKSPRVLVLSTHGFFLPDQDSNGVDNHLRSAVPTNSQNRPALLDESGKLIENPLLRCGLLLAGCNNHDKLPAGSKLDDGILTGMEIVGADLRGTELVVLSACETGIGKVNNGEGVAGLRQAFQLAGAQSVVSTLWQIPDQATAQLMNDFFANLAAGQSKSDALRNAQRARIQARREKHGAAHPLYWAAFTLTGQ